MRRMYAVWIALILLTLTACTETTPPRAEQNRAAQRQSLLVADAEFSALAFEQGLDIAYERFLAPEAVQLPDGGQPLAGKGAIMDNVLAVVADNEFSLSWEASDAVVSASGDMGFTWGYYYLEGVGPDGEVYTADGKYANFWSFSEADGWQVLLDTSNKNEPPYLDELELELFPEELTEAP